MILLNTKYNYLDLDDLMLEKNIALMKQLIIHDYMIELLTRGLVIIECDLNDIEMVSELHIRDTNYHWMSMIVGLILHIDPQRFLLGIL
jgi:hypothetical protein